MATFSTKIGLSIVAVAVFYCEPDSTEESWRHSDAICVSQGEGLSEHTAPFDALVICAEGEAEIEISGEKYRLQEGETITMSANAPHAVRAASDFKMLLVMIKA